MNTHTRKTKTGNWFYSHENRSHFKSKGDDNCISSFNRIVPTPPPAFKPRGPPDDFPSLLFGPSSVISHLEKKGIVRGRLCQGKRGEITLGSTTPFRIGQSELAHEGRESLFKCTEEEEPPTQGKQWAKSWKIRWKNSFLFFPREKRERYFDWNLGYLGGSCFLGSRNVHSEMLPFISPSFSSLWWGGEITLCVCVVGALARCPFLLSLHPPSYLPMHVHTHILVRTDCVTRICPFALLLVISSSLPPFFFQPTIITMHPPPPVWNLEILDALLFPPTVKRTNFETLHARRFPVNKKKERGDAPQTFFFSGKSLCEGWRGVNWGRFTRTNSGRRTL